MFLVFKEQRLSIFGQASKCGVQTKMLQAFKDYRGTVVNLTRPQTLGPWGEVFELDFEGKGDIGYGEREG